MEIKMRYPHKYNEIVKKQRKQRKEYILIDNDKLKVLMKDIKLYIQKLQLFAKEINKKPFTDIIKLQNTKEGS